jgi:hypothetical protein
MLHSLIYYGYFDIAFSNSDCTAPSGRITVEHRVAKDVEWGCMT